MGALDNAVTTEHPSYGLLQISRAHGGGDHLFGSSIPHHNTIRLRVNRAKHVRDLNHDWYMEAGGRPEIVEVEMSTAQFAEAITSLNQGAGTPCTIRYVQGKRMPDPPFESQRELFRDEFKKTMSETAQGFAAGIKEVADLLAKPNINKSDRKAILNVLNALHAKLTCTVPFIHRSFDEACDRTVTAAKAEIEAAALNTTLMVGQQALVEQKPAPLELALIDGGD